MPEQIWRVGHHQPQNVYEGDRYVGVMFSPADAARVVAAMNGEAAESLVARAVQIEDDHHAYEKATTGVTPLSMATTIQGALIESGLMAEGVVHINLVVHPMYPKASILSGRHGSQYTRDEAERLGQALGLATARWAEQGEPGERIATLDGTTSDGVQITIHCQPEDAP